MTGESSIDRRLPLSDHASSGLGETDNPTRRLIEKLDGRSHEINALSASAIVLLLADRHVNFTHIIHSHYMYTSILQNFCYIISILIPLARSCNAQARSACQKSKAKYKAKSKAKKTRPEKPGLQKFRAGKA